MLRSLPGAICQIFLSGCSVSGGVAEDRVMGAVSDLLRLPGPSRTESVSQGRKKTVLDRKIDRGLKVVIDQLQQLLHR